MVVRVIELCKGYKSYNVNRWTMTMTLNWPWSNIHIAHRLIILDICAELFVNANRGLTNKERTRNTVIQCLILNYDFAHETILVKHTQCTLTHHTWHLSRVICEFHQGIKRYRADTEYSYIMLNLELWPWPWTDRGLTTRKTWQTDRQTDGRTGGLQS